MGGRLICRGRNAVYAWVRASLWLWLVHVDGGRMPPDCAVANYKRERRGPRHMRTKLFPFRAAASWLFAETS